MNAASYSLIAVTGIAIVTSILLVQGNYAEFQNTNSELLNSHVELKDDNVRQAEEINKLKAELASLKAHIHRHDVRTKPMPALELDPTPVPALILTMPDKASTDFEDGLHGWKLHAVLSDAPRLIEYPNPYSHYQMDLTRDDSYHIPLTTIDPYKTTTHAKIYGEGWDVGFGLANIIAISDISKLILSFDAKIAGLNNITYAPEAMPNLHIVILDDTYSKAVKYINLVGNSDSDQAEDNGPWQHYEVDLTPHIKGKTNLPLMIMQYDSWFADGEQVLWVDNIKLDTN